MVLRLDADNARIDPAVFLRLRVGQTVNAKLLPVLHSTSFSGISFVARSTKFGPLQCIGITCSRWNFYLAEIAVRSRYQVKAADKCVSPFDDADSRAHFRVLIIPAYPQELMTNSPRSLSRKQVACSCQCWSGCGLPAPPR